MYYVARRTMNPAADLQRGWSAWGGMYEAHPFSLAAVEMKLCERDDVEFIEDARKAAEFVRDELDLDVQKCPATGMYALRHHDGLSSYELDADSIDTAISAAKSLNANWLTGGCCAVKPVAFHHVADDIYVFECEAIEAQHDS